MGHCKVLHVVIIVGSGCILCMMVAIGDDGGMVVRVVIVVNGSG